ncbi:MAG: hypothetical protein QOG67_3556 [Verrucomicrobiota bacterium]|jgi:hypothetical protein
MLSRNKKPKHDAAFALVVTLLMVVLAAVIVVGLLANASSDRNTAASVADRYKAEIAAETGLEAAKKALSAISSDGYSRTMNDHFVVVSSPDANGVPYLFIGCAEDPNNDGKSDYAKPAIQYFPLYAGGQTQPNLAITSGAAPTPAPSLDASGTIAQQVFGGKTINYPLLFATAPHSTWQQKLQTNWQVLSASSATAEHYRFTYWIEDLDGYIDANVAGNLDDSSTKHIRNLGYNPNELALFTLFNPSLQSDDGSTYAKTLVANHTLLFTPLTTRVGGTAASADDIICTTSLVANLATDNEQSVIPFGLGFPSQGKPKTNLNDIIKNSPGAAGVKKIGNAISTDLPKFASTRKGGFDPSQDYNKTLAASFIDYADLDSDPTIGSDYRGIDLMPFVVEVYEMYYWEKDYYQNGGTGNFFVDVRVKTFVQLWNMFGKDITTGVFVFNDMNKAGLQFGPTGPISSFDKATVIDAKISIDLSKKPLTVNEYRAVLACDRLYTLDTGATTKPVDSKGKSSAIHIGDNSAPTKFDKQSSYDVQWNGISYDRPGANAPNVAAAPAIERNDCSLSKPGDVTMNGTIPGLRYTQSSGDAPYDLGDPRMSYYIKEPQWSSAYVGESAWGGQVYMKTNVDTKGWLAGESRVAGWADSGHSSARGVTPTASPASTAQDPTTLGPAPTPEPSKAPARISNDGQFHSIAELSYIYDPFQQDPFTKVPTSIQDVDTTWRDAWKNGFNASSAIKNKYGSHSTLRIGRPEFKDFDTDDARAARLLDLLSVGDITTNSVSTRGLININTASRDVLRTLGAGIKIGNLNKNDVDPLIQGASAGSNVYGPTSAGASISAGDAFADAVIARRTKQPFLSTSQLAQITATDKNGNKDQPFFGNPDQWLNGDGPKVETTTSSSPGTTPPITAGTVDWNDAASEQYFAKIFNFTNVRSRNFRVFVTGQVYAPANGAQPERVIATANKVYEVFLDPKRDATGAISSQTCDVKYAADLPY